MLMFYRQLLRLYPALHRQQFGEEMLAVFLEARSDHAKRKSWARIIFSLREIVGLMRGACQEHVHDALGPDLEISFPTRSIVMRNGFRFPKTTAVLMTLILAGVIGLAERAAIMAAPPVPPAYPGPYAPTAYATGTQVPPYTNVPASGMTGSADDPLTDPNRRP